MQFCWRECVGCEMWTRLKPDSKKKWKEVSIVIFMPVYSRFGQMGTIILNLYQLFLLIFAQVGFRDKVSTGFGRFTTQRVQMSIFSHHFTKWLHVQY